MPRGTMGSYPGGNGRAPLTLEGRVTLLEERVDGLGDGVEKCEEQQGQLLAVMARVEAAAVRAADHVVAIGQRLDESQRAHDRADKLRDADMGRRLDRLESTVGDLEDDTQVQTREQLQLRIRREEAEAERLRAEVDRLRGSTTPGSVSVARWQAIGVIVAAALTGGGGVLLAKLFGIFGGN